MTTDPAIIEAAARAMSDEDAAGMDPWWYRNLAQSALAAVTPMIEAAALERAAKAIETEEEDYLMRGEVVAAIRALKEQP
jgi:hypothetical protein